MTRTLIFDTETTGKASWGAPLSAQPYLVQIALQLIDDETGRALGHFSAVTVPEFKGDRVNISAEVQKIHGIGDAEVEKFGLDYKFVAPVFSNFARRADRIVAHNSDFDSLILLAMFSRIAFPQEHVRNTPLVCTMRTLMPQLKIPARYPKPNDPYAFVSLQKAHMWAKNPYDWEEGVGFEDAHDAMNDVDATALVWRAIIENEVPLVQRQWPGSV